MNTKRKELTIFVFILSSLLFFVCIAVFTVPSIFVRPSEGNTTELSATIKEVEIKDTSGSEHGSIFTEEYDFELLIKFKAAIDTNDFINLQKGQKVWFRVEHIWLDQLEETPFIYTVSIRTEEKEIISLSSYNEFLDHEIFLIRATGVLLGLILLVIIVHFVLLLKGINIFHSLRK